MTPTSYFLHSMDDGAPTAAARWYWPESTRCEVWTAAIPEWTERAVFLDLNEDPDWEESDADAVLEWIGAPSTPAPAEFALEFANPWHDEAGRFAPKGTGRRYSRTMKVPSDRAAYAHLFDRYAQGLLDAAANPDLNPAERADAVFDAETHLENFQLMTERMDPADVAEFEGPLEQVRNGEHPEWSRRMYNMLDDPPVDFVETFDLAVLPEIDIETVDLRLGPGGPLTGGQRHYVEGSNGRIGLSDRAGTIPPERVREMLGFAALAADAGFFDGALYLSETEYTGTSRPKPNGWVNLDRPAFVNFQEGYLSRDPLPVPSEQRESFMAADHFVGEHAWTTLHEIGHSVHGTNRTASYERRVEKLFKKHDRSPLISNYGATSHYEMYAEAFAQWVATGGTTNNPVVVEFASEFSWSKSRGITASAGDGERVPSVTLLEFIDPITGERSGAAIPNGNDS